MKISPPPLKKWRGVFESLKFGLVRSRTSKVPLYDSFFYYQYVGSVSKILKNSMHMRIKLRAAALLEKCLSIEVAEWAWRGKWKGGEKKGKQGRKKGKGKKGKGKKKSPTAGVRTHDLPLYRYHLSPQGRITHTIIHRKSPFWWPDYGYARACALASPKYLVHTIGLPLVWRA